MDGMLHTRDEVSAPMEAASFLGILYAEDFDDPPASASHPAEPAAEPLTQYDVDKACAEAVDDARRDWAASSEQQRTHLLAGIAIALADARDQAEKTALQAAEGTVTAMLAGALPRLCSEHGPTEIRALVTRLLPNLRTEPRITIRVHADLVHELKRAVADLEHDMSGVITVQPAPVQRGDVKVSWDNGSMARDTRQIHQAMQDALGLLGLQQPLETASKRKMAHAE